jgi:hypothetical protein
VEIRRRAVVSSIDPSIFSIGIWNDLEARYMAKKVLSLVQSDLKHNTPSTQNNPRTNRMPFRNQEVPGYVDSSKSGRCIFCGSRSKEHPSKNCLVSVYDNGSPCFMQRREPSGVRQSKSGKRLCFSWNGSSGCDQGSSCRKGEHCCTLCGVTIHSAQQCDVVV